MRHVCEIEIEKPVDVVVRLFDDPDNMGKWMPGLRGFEHLSGEPGQPGSRSRLNFDINGRKLEMIETITVRDLPGEFSGTYEAPGVFNTITNSFEEIDGGTRWVAENEFRFSSLMMKMMSFLMPGAYRKQTVEHMQAFKGFAESIDTNSGEEDE